MKKLVKTLSVILAVVASLSVNGQTKIGSYQSSYFTDKTYSVSYSVNENGEIQYWIDISGSTKYKLYNFMIEGKDIDKFRKSLNDFKQKYVEWKEVAKNNNISSLDKNMDIVFPFGTFMWVSGDKYYFNFHAKPEPRFLIVDGKYLGILFSGKEFESSSNQYITEKAYWVFGSKEEIEELEYLISEENMNKIQEEKNKKDDLFK